MDHLASFKFPRCFSKPSFLLEIGLKRKGFGYNNYMIIDKHKWMLAKIKHGF
jgi:hypothetical protein